MGQLIYNSDVTVIIEDRLLTHLQHVITGKLRRGESVPFTWFESGAIGSRQIWLHPGRALSFTYVEAPQPLNPAWIALLLRAANSRAGLRPLPEPEAESAEPA
jgi:hypothetical protein